MTPNSNTPMFPTDAAPVTVGQGFSPSAIYVGGAGDVTVTTAGGQSVTFSGVAAGSVIPVLVINVTAATATNMVRVF